MVITVHPKTTRDEWSDSLQQILAGQPLSVSRTTNLIHGWLEDEIPPVLSGALLTALHTKGISPEELTVMARVLREISALPASGAPVIDTCGTGGDGASTFNISTAVAFVVAAAGVKVAKHGNRSASGKVGSADVLEASGIDLNASKDTALAALDEVGITFLFANRWHPALKKVSELRRTLRIRTVFNLLGPLLNPLCPTGQVIGVNDPALIPTFAEVLPKLGTRRGIILHGREKLDEAGLAEPTDLAIVTSDSPNYLTLTPSQLGIEPASTLALRGGDLQENAGILRSVLRGEGTTAQENVVCLNAALALFVGETVNETEDYIDTFTRGFALAKDVVKSGEPWRKLQQLARFIREN